MSDAAKPRLLVVNQYYWPGVEATAQLLTELCEALADDYDIRVLTGVLHGHEDRPRSEARNGVRIIRVPSTAFERSHLALRALNYVTFVGSALAAGIGGRRPDIVLCMTDPPMVGDVGLAVARRFGVPLLVISQDVFPEIATKVGRLESRLLVDVLRRLVRLYLTRADRVVAIGDTMRLRLEEKGAPADRIRVIPNWVDTEAISPQAVDNDWARDNELSGKFVVMHSGNVGHAQDLDTLVRASTFLRDMDDLQVVVIGSGARLVALEAFAERVDASAVRFLPYQDSETVPLSLSSADMHFVGLASGLAGYVVPSRLYGIMAAGRPVIAAADSESETASLVAEVGCGVVVPPGRADLVAAVIRDARGGRYDLDQMGSRGRDYVSREADRARAVAQYSVLINELIGIA